MDKFLNQMGLASLDEQTVRMMNPLKLAYLGDALFEGYIRNYLINEVVLTPHEMSKKAIKYVKASSQAKLIMGIKEELTEEEWSLVKRGRNQKSATVPKNALLSDYKYATGFEALVGYLYLMGREDRLIEVVSMGIKYLENPSVKITPESECNDDAQ
ncbi:Mini-ribonuclease 3 [Fusibacter bizertensis]